MQVFVQSHMLHPADRQDQQEAVQMALEAAIKKAYPKLKYVLPVLSSVFCFGSLVGGIERFNCSVISQPSLLSTFHILDFVSE